MPIIQISDQSTAALRTHQANIISADQVRQIAHVGATMNPAGAATVRNADIAYYRSLLASARAAGVDAGPFVQALVQLGTGGS